MRNIISQEAKNHIDEMCKKYKITSYKINPDGSIDVRGNVMLGNKRLGEIPLKFGKVSGNFSIFSNIISSLKNAPYEVGGTFNCADNRLTSLEYCPRIVGKDFKCYMNNITSLGGCPESVNNFQCHTNKLTSLEFTPVVVKGDYFCNNNLLTSLDYLPQDLSHNLQINKNRIISLKGCPTNITSLDCASNKLTSLEYCPTELLGDLHCGSNKLTSLEYCPHKIGGLLNVSNNKLKSLKWCTTKVTQEFLCQRNLLNSLEYMPVIQNFKYLIYDTHANDPFPLFTKYLKDMTLSDIEIFLKYQNQFGVWDDDVFNEDICIELIDEIKDGLR